MGHNYVGRTADGDRVWVEITTETTEGTWQTVTHEPITDPVRLAVTFAAIYKGSQAARRGDYDACGGGTQYLRDVVDFTGSSFTETDRDSVVALAERWHLNDMRQACAHMPAGASYQDDTTTACPETGYLIGRAWLVEPLPDAVLAEVTRLQSLPVQSTPDYMAR